MPKFNRETFNTDPKHAEERENFDSMVEDSVNRIIGKKAEAAKVDKPKKGFFDSIFESNSGSDEKPWPFNLFS